VFDIEINKIYGKYVTRVNDVETDMEPEIDKFGQISALKIDGNLFDVKVTKGKDDYKVITSRKPLNVRLELSKTDVVSLDGNDNKVISVKAPMSGLVIAIHVKTGDIVDTQSSLIVLEAMKMQNDIRSPIKAKISGMFVKVGQTVEKDDKLMNIEPTD
jgi:biotin carboxyl carrier protein